VGGKEFFMTKKMGLSAKSGKLSFALAIKTSFGGGSEEKIADFSTSVTSVHLLFRAVNDDDDADE
jgi:hypothetical protein